MGRFTQRVRLAAFVFLGITLRATAITVDDAQQKPITDAAHKDRETRLISSLKISDDFQIPDAQPPPSDKGTWLGWGADVYSNRWAASDAIVNTDNVNSLSPHCIKNYDPGVSASALVVDGVAYFPTWSGLLVALDYINCETIWSVNVTKVIQKFKPLDRLQAAIVRPVSRTTPVVDGDTLFIGTLAHSLVIAFDKTDGSLIDTIQVSSHPFAVLTMSPVFYEDKLFIGVSSLEEGVADLIEDYKLSFVGSMNAIELSHGRLSIAWTTSMMPEGTNFTGAAVWGSQPSIDPIRRQVFIATGNVYDLTEEFEECVNKTANIAVIREGLTTDACLPRNVYQEAVVALDLDTGRVNWVHVLSPLDAWNVACVDGLLGGAPNPDLAEACPDNPGPDADFGMAPAFVLGNKNTPHGLDVVVVGQKNGNLYSLTAQTGALNWAISTSPGGLGGGLSWGVAVDDGAVYYTAINSLRINYTVPHTKNVISNSAWGAASLKDGAILWQTPVPGNMTSEFVVLDKKSGKILKEEWLDAYFHGALATVHEYVFLGTGYGGLQPNVAGSFQVWKVQEGKGGGCKTEQSGKRLGVSDLGEL